MLVFLLKSLTLKVRREGPGPSIVSFSGPHAIRDEGAHFCAKAYPARAGIPWALAVISMAKVKAVFIGKNREES